MQILKPGLYRTHSGQRVEVISIADNTAFGVFGDCRAPGLWNCMTGDGFLITPNIVSECREKHSRTVEVRMVRGRNQTGEPSVYLANPGESLVAGAVLLAVQRLTITEGAGLLNRSYHAADLHRYGVNKHGVLWLTADGPKWQTCDCSAIRFDSSEEAENAAKAADARDPAAIRVE